MADAWGGAFGTPSANAVSWGSVAAPAIDSGQGGRTFAPRPRLDWSWLEHAYAHALVQANRLGFEQGFREGLADGLAADEEEADFNDTGLEPDEDLMGKRYRRKKERK